MSKKDPCPLGGDNTNCGDCSYYPDFAWSNKHNDCMRQDLLNEEEKYKIKER